MKELELHSIPILTSLFIVSCSTVDIITSDSARVPLTTPVAPSPHDSICYVPILLSYDPSVCSHQAVEGDGETVSHVLQAAEVSICN